MKIIVDIFTKNVVGIDGTKKPATYIIDVPKISLSKEIEETVKRHKINEDGKLLYLKKTAIIINGLYEEQIIEVPFDREKVNGELTFYKPSLEETKVMVNYNITENPSAFTSAEVVDAKSKEIVKDSSYTNILLFEEFNESNLSTDLSSNSANTGFKTMRILPIGQCRTNKIMLSESVTKVKIYVEKEEGIDVEVGSTASSFASLISGEASFETATNSIYIKFKNNADEVKEVFSYGVLF